MSKGVTSGDLRGHSVDSPRLIHFSGSPIRKVPYIVRMGRRPILLENQILAQVFLKLCQLSKIDSNISNMR
jgi:hypothetical protein